MPCSSIKGARGGQEDYSNMFRNEYYAAVYGCDGHNGAVVSNEFGNFFHSHLHDYLKSRSNNENIDEIRDSIVEIYYTTIKYIDSQKITGGCTFSAGIYQIQTGLFITIQVGDSKIMVLDPFTGNMAKGEVLSVKDYASLDKEIICDPGMVMDVVTQTHDFGNTAEIARYQEYLDLGSRVLMVSRRSDAQEAENRFRAKVSSGWIQSDLVEPSRTIEHCSFYSTIAIHDLQPVQNPPETMIWRLDPTNATAIAFFCDGFESKLAIPSNESIARLIANPGLYMMSETVANDTVIGEWFENGTMWPDGPIKKTICGSDWSPSEGEYVKPGDPRFASKPFVYVAEMLLGIAPDKSWQEAVLYSLGELERLHQNAIAEGRICIPSLIINPEIAVIAATHVPVLLASDDNVTLEVQII